MNATLFLLLALIFPIHSSFSKERIVIGSKPFTEGYVLAHFIAEVINRTGEAEAELKTGFGGGTSLVYAALKSGEIDLYPEYTGTISHSLLKAPHLKEVSQIRRELEKEGLTISDSLGFNNTYALAVRKEKAAQLGLSRVSDLTRHPELRGGFTAEFVKRKDGLEALRRFYGFDLKKTTRMEHSLAYEAIESGKIDLMDVYSTDAKLKKFDLVSLEDDRGFFPRYYGVFFMRLDLKDRFPKTWKALKSWEGRLSNEKMIAMNARVELDKQSFRESVVAFLGQQRTPSGEVSENESNFWSELGVLTRQHLFLVLVSLGFSALVGVPLGILAFRFARVGQLTLALTGLLQTVPSLALLCFLIPLFGIGTLPSLIALFLYGLLPIVRSTYSGLATIDSKLREAANAIGLTRWEQTRLVELPLASISIMSGIKTSATINVGTATLAAFIGAGGYGSWIVTGLALNDTAMILGGAVPAALLALALHWAFEGVDRWVIPRGLRL